MAISSRRVFLQSAFGLAAASSGALLLDSRAQATPSSGVLGSYGKFLGALGDEKPTVEIPTPAKLVATEDNILGPFHRKGAPFRAKITPPLIAGTVLLISGRVWALDKKKPLAGAMLDIWQADSKGRYDNDVPDKPPKSDVFLNRARLLSDENGFYEFETIHPGRYKIGPETWRPSHIHYLVRARGYKQLVTQLYFKGDPHNKTDEFIKPSLIIDVRNEKASAGNYEAGTFDIVLAPE